MQGAGREPLRGRLRVKKRPAAHFGRGALLAKRSLGGSHATNARRMS
jgi:hypothetical protein